ncbi:hypothetical protein LUZ60_017330 [Juncus effusus]|nr:hypothetical protein LUZ60_017330 [Juncus effusus]
MKFLKRLLRVGDSLQYQALNQTSKTDQYKSRVRVPTGHIPVYVGEAGTEEDSMKRFVIKVELLSGPDFSELLSRAADEYGYNKTGALRIPCSVSDFEQLITRADQAVL